MQMTSKFIHQQNSHNIKSVNEINNWLIINYLLLNIKKRELININMTNSTESFPDIYINNTIILSSNSVKYQGLQ